MVQQLSLVSSIPKSQYKVLMLCLESYTGMNPHPLRQHTVILKPKYPFTPEMAAGKVNQIESYRIRMTRVWDNPNGFSSNLKSSSEQQQNQVKTEPSSDSTSTSATTSGDTDNSKPSPSSKQGLKGEPILDTFPPGTESTRNSSIWTLQLSDIPAGGKRTVSIQNIYETTIYETDDIMGYVDELGYTPDIEFWNNGVRFYYNDIVIEVFRLYVHSRGGHGQQAGGGVGNGNVNGVHQVSLRLLDGSENYQVKCFVNVSKLNDLENVARGAKQLENLKNDLSGLLNLDVPDRISLDSRVNSRIVAGNINKK
ncbi:unnamed protein product [Ambrosiozyma monospora]|uniref:Mediator of RNA polymerase II transcription subunit 18 n=1 Tax=Ambrosiozyma monospora TaxID=43982 RepID=A0A9W7DFV7_AMBMO|nr:unnamed protein product [Ambrosiozyma monospora]